MAFRHFSEVAAADVAGFPRLDPCCYVRQADVALLYGRRDEAVALIELAYLAYDRVLATCDEITDWDKAWSERSS
jgi:hypothetical protein